jgi:hypothetical protein
MEGHVARMWEMSSTYKVLIWSPERKGPIWKFSRTWEGDIEIDIKDIQLEDVNWILSQGKAHWLPLVNTVVKLWVT